jgi:1-phosphatidylinositol-3-phosphate 5-kinase
MAVAVAALDAHQLTSYNPFSEEDEHEQGSYNALVTSLFSRVRTSLVGGGVGGGGRESLSGGGEENVEGDNKANASPALMIPKENTKEPTRPMPVSNNSNGSNGRPNALSLSLPSTAPPLVSLTPVTSESPFLHGQGFGGGHQHSGSNDYGFYSPLDDTFGGGAFGTSIPGFPIADDARSVRTSLSISGNPQGKGGVSRVIRKIRGEGEFSLRL